MTPSTRFRYAATGALLFSAGLVVGSVAGPSGLQALPSAQESTTVTVDNTRVLDTREGIEVGLTGRFVAGVARKLQVTGPITTYDEATTTTSILEVVPDGATGVLLNVTVFKATSTGFPSVRPGSATVV